MTHSEFIKKDNNGQLRIHVNEYYAKQLLMTNILPKKYVYFDTFWSWIWMLSFPTGIAVIIWVDLWLGILVLIVGINLPKYQKRWASKFVVQFALQNEEFYYEAIENALIELDAPL